MGRLRSLWDDHFLLYEGIMALVVTSAIFYVFTHTLNPQDVLEFIKGYRVALYGALAALFGSLLGFAITALTVLIGFSQHERLAIVRNSSAYPTLWKIFTHAIWALALSTAVSLAALVADRDASPSMWLLVAVIFVTLLSAVRLCRVIWIIERIVAIVAAAREPAPDNLNAL